MNADQPFWLVGMTEMTRTFGLELLEAVLASFPTIFATVSTVVCTNMATKFFTKDMFYGFHFLRY